MRRHFIKYKFHRLSFWGFYHYCWWTIAMGNPVKAATTIFGTFFFIKYIFYVLFQTTSAWFHLYWLMPRYLEKYKIIPYIIGTSIAIIPGYYLTAAAMHQTVHTLFNVQGSSILQFVFGPSTATRSTSPPIESPSAATTANKSSTR